MFHHPTRALALLSFAFVLLAPAALAQPAVTSLTLIDADTDQPLRTLAAGDTLDLSALGASLSLRADVSGAVGSVRFDLDGQTGYQVENVAPFALAGDSGGEYNAVPKLGQPGAHTVTATPFAQGGAGGAAGQALTLDFAVVTGSGGGGGGGGGGQPGCVDGEGRLTFDDGAGGFDFKRWHPVTISYEGPCASEDGTPNPFLDYRFEVSFTSYDDGSVGFTVPGYFAADGDAAQTGATSGNVWRAHFTPPIAGNWSVVARIYGGPGVAIADDPDAAGQFLGNTPSVLSVDPAPPCDGCTDNRRKGVLRYVGERYLRFDNGEYFVKGGADSPENLLAYSDFDGTFDRNGQAKTWQPHVQDWNAGDPAWQGGKGKGLIGALNYLAGEGMNAFSFLPFNSPLGDGRDVWPWTTPGDTPAARLRYDVSKLAQWEIVFTHADSLGLFLHFKTQETENDQVLDGGALGTQRKLYYRELVARFGHHLALNWNLGEENTNTTAERKAFAAYFAELDPYDHPIVVHTFPGQKEQVYGPLVGDPSMTGASLQLSNVTSGHEVTLEWLERSAQAGRPWHVAIDEPGNAQTGVTCDGPGNNYGDARRNPLWGNLMAGGTGVEWYFGYQTCGGTGNAGDLAAQDWRTRDELWNQTRHALAFFRAHLPFWEMDNANALTPDPDDYVLAKPGAVYAVYLPDGGAPTLTLPQGAFDVAWYNPRTGGALQGGATVAGGGARALGTPPSDPGADWVALVTSSGDPGDPVDPPVEGEVVFALNAGGGAVTTGGVAYSADAGASGGRTYATGDAIAGTDADALYQSERYGTFAYAVALPAGTYDVTLQFAEVFFTEPGRRVFSAQAEGVPLVADLDLFATAGHDAAYDVTRRVTVTDGALDLAFEASVNNAKLSAVVVRAAGEAGWREAFDLADGTQQDDGPTAWTVQAPPTGVFGVQDGAFVAGDTDTEGVWRSAPIDLAGVGAAGLSLVVRSQGSMETSGPAADYLRVSYVLDGGAEVLVAERLGNFNGDAAQTVAAGGLEGATLEVIVRAVTTGASEFYSWDDVTVVGTAAQSAFGTEAFQAEAPAEMPVRVYPNPTAQSATFAYALEAPARVRLEVYDALGRRVATLADGERAAGQHSVRFERGTLASGFYHWRLSAGERVETGQLVVTR